jgi:hypothetical protein
MATERSGSGRVIFLISRIDVARLAGSTDTRATPTT